MALIVKNNKFQQIPDGAVQLSETQALQYQTSIISNWAKFSDV